MKQQLLKQLAHEQWANNILIQHLKQTPEAPARAFELIGHVVAVHDIWRSRFQQNSSKYGLWDLKDLDATETLIQENTLFWNAYIEDLDNESFTKKIAFNYFGTPAEVSVDDALTHMFTHSAYHRGQIVTLLKGYVDPLPVVTYLAYAIHA